MTEPTSHSRLIDLLVLRSTEGLRAAEDDEIPLLGPMHPDLPPDHFDAAASAIALVDPRDGLDMPAELQSIVLSRAEVVLESTRRAQSPSPHPEDPKHSSR